MTSNRDLKQRIRGFAQHAGVNQQEARRLMGLRQPEAIIRADGTDQVLVARIVQNVVVLRDRADMKRTYRRFTVRDIIIGKVLPTDLIKAAYAHWDRPVPESKSAPILGTQLSAITDFVRANVKDVNALSLDRERKLWWREYAPSVSVTDGRGTITITSDRPFRTDSGQEQPNLFWLEWSDGAKAPGMIGMGMQRQSAEELTAERLTDRIARGINLDLHGISPELARDAALAIKRLAAAIDIYTIQLTMPDFGVRPAGDYRVRGKGGMTRPLATWAEALRARNGLSDAPGFEGVHRDIERYAEHLGGWVPSLTPVGDAALDRALETDTQSVALVAGTKPLYLGDVRWNQEVDSDVEESDLAQIRGGLRNVESFVTPSGVTIALTHAKRINGMGDQVNETRIRIIRNEEAR